MSVIRPFETSHSLWCSEKGRLVRFAGVFILSAPFVNGLNNHAHPRLPSPAALLKNRRAVLRQILPPLATLTATKQPKASMMHPSSLTLAGTRSKLWLPPDRKKSATKMSFSTVAGAIDSVIVMLHESQYSMNELAMDMATNFYHPPPSVVLSEPAKGEWPSRSSLAVVTIACDDATPSSIASAVDSLAETVGECNTAILGHGLGGTMAMWAALRCLLPSSSSGDDNKSVAGANPIFAPSVSLSMNAPLDLKWALEQRHIDKSLPWIRPNGSDAATIHWESPIDVLPPATRSLRLREASRPRNLFLPANCYLGVIHGDDDAVIPAAHGIRFTVAACVGGVEVELHRMKREGGHCDCLDPSSDSWRAAKDIIRRGWTSGTSRATPVMTIGWEEMVDPQRMRPTQRDETGSEVIIRTHR